MDKLLSLFQLPAKSYINKRIPLKAIIDEYSLGKQDEKLLRSHIESLEMISALNTETTFLKPSFSEEMDFIEINILFCQLKKSNESIKLDQRLHFFFQNPTIIIYQYNNQYRLTISKKRKSKINQNESVVEHTYYTNLFRFEDLRYSKLYQKLTYSNQKFIDLKDLYEYYNKIITNATMIKYLEEYPSKLFDVEIVQSSINDIEQINSTINKNKEILKNSYSMSDRIEINDLIQQLETEIFNILKTYRNED